MVYYLIRLKHLDFKMMMRTLSECISGSDKKKRFSEPKKRA